MTKIRMVRGFIDGEPVFHPQAVEVSEEKAAMLLKRRKFSKLQFMAAQEEGVRYNGKFMLESDFQKQYAEGAKVVKSKESPALEESDIIEPSEAEAPKRGRKPKSE